MKKFFFVMNFKIDRYDDPEILLQISRLYLIKIAKNCQSQSFTSTKYKRKYNWGKRSTTSDSLPLSGPSPP
jgi:hypothetical protein